jgi:nucleoside triphosphate pyrophosphatase
VSVPPAPPLLLASTSPQRRAILEQLGIPFELAVPDYEEHDPPDADPVTLVRDHAAGKAKPSGPEEAEEMLDALGGHTHEVVSGLCLRTPGWEAVEHEVTRVTFRPLTARDLATYVVAGEWEGRAGGYAIQGLGAALVERVEGDYLNVVGLPAALLVRLLSERFAGVYGFG